MRSSLSADAARDAPQYLGACASSESVPRGASQARRTGSSRCAQLFFDERHSSRRVHPSRRVPRVVVSRSPPRVSGVRRGRLLHHHDALLDLRHVHDGSRRRAPRAMHQRKQKDNPPAGRMRTSARKAAARCVACSSLMDTSANPTREHWSQLFRPADQPWQWARSGIVSLKYVCQLCDRRLEVSMQATSAARGRAALFARW